MTLPKRPKLLNRKTTGKACSLTKSNMCVFLEKVCIAVAFS